MFRHLKFHKDSFIWCPQGPLDGFDEDLFFTQDPKNRNLISWGKMREVENLFDEFVSFYHHNPTS